MARYSANWLATAGGTEGCPPADGLLADELPCSGCPLGRLFIRASNSMSSKSARGEDVDEVVVVVVVYSEPVQVLDGVWQLMSA